MRNFLKQNLLAILVCLFAAFTYASASVITRPYGASDYAGGTKAVGSKVNAEFASIVAWLNGGNIGSDNIATGGVATANIASLAVTTAKIANNAVTKGKLEAANLQVTSSSSLYVITNTVTPATVTNLSATITTTGRPVSVRLENNPGQTISSGVSYYTGFVHSFGAGAYTAGNYLFFVRDSSTTAHWNVYTSSGVDSSDFFSCSDFRYTETNLAAGTYTFALKASNGNNSSTSLSVFNCRLVVEEL